MSSTMVPLAPSHGGGGVVCAHARDACAQTATRVLAQGVITWRIFCLQSFCAC
jgi:hypothetical protein